MKVESIQQQNNSFRGSNPSKVVSYLANHPGLVAGLASASVISQKVVLSTSELAMGPAMDIAIGKTITKITDEKDGRTNQSSKLQAIRTASQTIGGTITGVIVRALCRGLMTSLFMKGGQKLGEKSADLYNAVNPQHTKNLYELSKRAGKLGRDIGGALSVAVMMITNFLLDIPIINFINTKISDGVDYISKHLNNREKANG